MIHRKVAVAVAAGLTHLHYRARFDGEGCTRLNDCGTDEKWSIGLVPSCVYGDISREGGVGESMSVREKRKKKYGSKREGTHGNKFRVKNGGAKSKWR